MNKHEALIFLFTIAKEMKHSLDKPVILVTQKDYAEGVYNSLVEMRSALLQQAEPQRVLDIVSAFHGEWLTAVNDVEQFKKRIRATPRETVLRTVDFTKECIKKRQKAFNKYVTRLQSTLTEEENSLMLVDLNTIADMQKSVFAVLTEKQKTLRNTADPEEYYNKISDEIEELMNWLDSLNDSLAIQFSKVLGLKFPRLTSDLTKTLQQIIDEINTSDCIDKSTLITETQRQGRRISGMIRYHAADELEIRDIIKKIKILQVRIDRLKDENSSAVMALEHKTQYLEERLQSLENLKTSLLTLRSKQEVEIEIDEQDLPSNATFHIFDHLLPAPERVRLIEELMSLWTEAIFVFKDSKSIISILSATDMKEVFADDLGKFVVDKYGRKVYNVGTNDYAYQSNEINKLVPLNDDDRHIYFFDDCGRYYINEEEDRIYKANDSASEYKINREGLLLKVGEIRNGIKYSYDDYGKYYIDQNRRIYCDDATGTKYENDGLGNLIRIRSKETIYKLAPLGPMELEENIYLKEVVGEALKKCIASVVLYQPLDPILYLAACLVRYRRNQLMQQVRNEDVQAMMAEREQRMRDRPDPSETHSDCGTEATTVVLDTNFVNYKTMEI